MAADKSSDGMLTVGIDLGTSRSAISTSTGEKIVADSFGSLNRDELVQRLDDADIAFGEVNTMADLTVHPHLRRIEVDTPKGVVTYSAPAAIFVGEPRHYRPVPDIGEHAELPKARLRKSS